MMLLRRLGVLLTFVTLLVGGWTASATTASAAPVTSGTLAAFPGCETVPVAQAPSDGIAGWLLPAPQSPPTRVDPTSGASLLQNYGAGGLGWFTFDDSCDIGVGGAANDVANGVSSSVLLPAVLIAAGTVSAGNAFGNPAWLDFMNPALGQVSAALAAAFSSPLMPLFVLISAIVALIAASAGRLSVVLRALVFVLIGLGVVGLTVGYPVKSATVIDGAVSSAVLSVQQTVVGGQTTLATAADREQPGAALVGPLYKSLIWDTWLRGQLGSDDSAVARKYGYPLYASVNLTYAEKAAVDRDPSGAGADIFEAKAQRFKEVADKIKAEDPGAYAVLTSSNFGQRFGLALGGSMVALLAFSLPFLSFIMLVLCLLYWRFAIMLGPMLGAVMVMMHSVARSVAKKLGAVVLNTVMFGAGAAVYVALARFIMGADLPFGWQVLALGVLTVVGWLLLHPVRALTRFTEINAPGYEGAPTSLVKRGASAVMGYAVTRKANADALTDAAEDAAPADPPAPGSQARPTYQWTPTQWTPTGPGPDPQAAAPAQVVPAVLAAPVAAAALTSRAGPEVASIGRLSARQIVAGEVVHRAAALTAVADGAPAATAGHRDARAHTSTSEQIHAMPAPSSDPEEIHVDRLGPPLHHEAARARAVPDDGPGRTFYDATTKTFVDAGGRRDPGPEHG